MLDDGGKTRRAARAAPSGRTTMAPRSEPTGTSPRAQPLLPPDVIDMAIIEVKTGDSYWSIARRQLGPEATNREVAARANQIWADNTTARDIIGPDANARGNPDFLPAGTLLIEPETAAAIRADNEERARIAAQAASEQQSLATDAARGADQANDKRAIEARETAEQRARETRPEILDTKIVLPQDQWSPENQACLDVLTWTQSPIPFADFPDDVNSVEVVNASGGSNGLNGGVRGRVSFSEDLYGDGFDENRSVCESTSGINIDPTGVPIKLSGGEFERAVIVSYTGAGERATSTTQAAALSQQRLDDALAGKTPASPADSMPAWLPLAPSWNKYVTVTHSSGPDVGVGGGPRLGGKSSPWGAALETRDRWGTRTDLSVEIDAHDTSHVRVTLVQGHNEFATDTVSLNGTFKKGEGSAAVGVGLQHQTEKRTDMSGTRFEFDLSNEGQREEYLALVQQGELPQDRSFHEVQNSSVFDKNRFRTEYKAGSKVAIRSGGISFGTGSNTVKEQRWITMNATTEREWIAPDAAHPEWQAGDWKTTITADPRFEMDMKATQTKTDGGEITDQRITLSTGDETDLNDFAHTHGLDLARIEAGGPGARVEYDIETKRPLDFSDADTAESLARMLQNDGGTLMWASVDHHGDYEATPYLVLADGSRQELDVSVPDGIPG